MRTRQLILSALPLLILLWGWQAPQPSWAGGRGHGSYKSYGHGGHQYRGLKSRHYGKHRGRHHRGFKSRRGHRYKQKRHGRHYRHRGHRDPRHRFHLYGRRGHYRFQRYRYRPYGHWGYYGRHNFRYKYRYGYRTDRPYGRLGRYYAEKSRGRGWALLEAGRAGEALESFGAAVQAEPTSGLPKVGFALGAADLGRLDTGVRAMRRALRVDPEALHHAAGKSGLQAKVQHLIRRYEGSSLYRAGNADAYFMLAALHYMSGDLQASKKNADRAGDGAPSTRNLYRLIDKRVAGQN